MLQAAIKDDTMGKTIVVVHFYRFKRGGMWNDNKPRSDRNSDS